MIGDVRIARTFRRPRAHRGFTMIELLIVIVVIGILMSLLIPAVIRALQRGQEARQRDEFSRLQGALESFKQQFGVYPPSRIRLRERTKYFLGDPFDNHSVTWLKRIWPSISIEINGTALDQSVTSAANHFLWCKDEATKYFNGPTDHNLNQTGRTYELEGDECLVFFLGGIAEFDRLNPESKIILHGFSKRATNPGGVPNPADPATLQRIQPFFEFRADQLFVRALIDTTRVYQEEFGANGTYSATANLKLPSYRLIGSDRSAARPIAYFSAYEGQGYRPHDFNMPDEALSGLYQFAYLPSSGAFQQYGSLPPNPYTETDPNPPNPWYGTPNPSGVIRYHKPNGFQLIAAGQDNLYGPGGQIPRNQIDMDRSGPSYDNLTNISSTDLLGVFNESAFKN